jgi:Flp pilus assembly protein TadG
MLEPQSDGRALHGQIAAIFALMVVVLMGMTGLALDVAHARSTAEDAQRAADAAAMAGVTYLPSDAGTAQTQAAALAKANGFVATSGAAPDACTNSPGDICIGYTPTASDRSLKVTITDRTPTSFLKVLGFSYLSVTRSATATYDDPIPLGAPDHMLGFPGFPTRAIPHVVGGVTSYPFGQGFTLELKAPYEGLEHGDAFSPYFANLVGDSMLETNGSGTAHMMLDNSCTSSSYLPTQTYNLNNICSMWDGTNQSSILNVLAHTSSVTLQPNPYFNQNNSDDCTPGSPPVCVQGYNFSFSIPASTVPANAPTVLIKILDPYDECMSPAAPTGNISGLNSNGSGSAVIYGSQFIDQCSTSYFGEAAQNGNSGNYQVIGQQYAAALQLTLSQPYVHLIYPINPAVAPLDTHFGVTINMSDPAMASPPPCQDTSSSGSDGSTGVPATLQCLGNGQIFGGDTAAGSPLHALHAFQWFTYAAVRNTSTSDQNVRLTIKSVCMTSPTYFPSKRCGTGGNNFSLAICKTDSTAAFVGQQNAAGAWAGAGVNGGGSGLGAATGIDIGCADPNYNNGDGYGCKDGTITCYHVNAINAFTIETLQQSAGPAFIPLAAVDKHYAGSTLQVRLYDAGDVGCSGCSGLSNTISVLGPGDDPLSLPNSSFSESYGLDITSPKNSGYSNTGNGRGNTAPNSSNKFFGYDATYGCTDYDADKYGPSGPLSTDVPMIVPPVICPSLTGTLYPKAVQVANDSGHAFTNGTWMTFHVPIAANYDPQNFTPVGSSWWKVYYNLTATSGNSPTANDTTTWQVVSGASPVHLTGQ